MPRKKANDTLDQTKKEVVEEVAVKNEAETAEAEATEPTEETKPAKKRSKKAAVSSEEPKESEDVKETVQEEKELSMEHLYEKRRTHMEKGKKKKPEIKVVAVDGIEIETEETKRQKEMDVLMRAARAIPPTRVKGRAVSFRKTEHQNDYIFEVRTIDENGKTVGEIPVYIPAEQFFIFKKEDYEGLKGEEHFENELKSRLNTEIEFCVFDVIEKDKVAYGSRLKAMESKSHLYYKKPYYEDKSPQITQGALVPAIVTSVRIDRVKVDVAGAECTIRSGEMSWLAQRDLRTEYKVGDTFLVKVLSIEPLDYQAHKQTYHLYKIDASKRLAEANPAEKYFESFHLGEICSGEVKVDNSEIGVFVRVKGLMDCLCPHPAAGTPEPGSEVSVVITSMHETDKRLYGFIKGI